MALSSRRTNLRGRSKCVLRRAPSPFRTVPRGSTSRSTTGAFRRSRASRRPLLAADGTMRFAHGYDPPSAMWCCNVAPLAVPNTPGRAEAEHALQCLRTTFRTFPFADASIVRDAAVPLVDLARPPSRMSAIAAARSGSARQRAIDIRCGQWQGPTGPRDLRNRLRPAASSIHRLPRHRRA